MAKYFIPLGIIVGLVCAFLLVRSLKGIGQAPASTIGGGAVAQSRPAASKPDTRQAPYLIYAEHLETWSPLNYVLETAEGGWYALGEMSSKGYVVAVSPTRAKVITPDGRTAWIVATRPVPAQAAE